MPLLSDSGGALKEILFVDDGSTDETSAIAAEYPLRLLKGPAGGPGAARNIGWRAARCDLVWFIDSDCAAQPKALELLLAAMGDDQRVAGVGGSYANLVPGSWLASLIHEEIVERHSAMPRQVNFLGAFNVLYRRSVLEAVGGFDEWRFNGPNSPGAEDGELAYRVRRAGFDLRFEARSIVGHFHPTRLMRYLRAQRHHGYWRVALYARHLGKIGGDAYSGIVDHCQPMLAMALLASAPTLWSLALQWIPAAIALLLVAAQIPMTWRLVRRRRDARYVLFAALGLVRSFWRGVGMIQGLVALPLMADRSRSPRER